MKFDKKPIQHISFIMDGNGRWAKKRLLPRTAGHNEGVKKAKEVILHIKKIGIPYVSLYTFSKENWKRSEQEISFLMNLILKHLKEEFDFYLKNKIRILHIGDREGVNQEVLKAIDKVVEETKEFESLTVLLAFNYSGRYDLQQAYEKLLAQKKSTVTEDDIEKALLTADIPEPDLIIRTSGEFRVSNYFLWQAAYSEFFVLEQYWPELKTSEIDQVIENYYTRDRRFGGTHE